MRISDWSSDVCSSDLHLLARHEGRPMTDIRALGYLKVQSQDIPRWRELTVDCLAMQETTGSDPDGLYLRMDERAARLVVVPGDSDRVIAVGDRKSVVSGKSVSVRGDLGGRRIIKKKKVKQ